MSEPRYSLDDFNTIPAQLIGDNGVERDSWLPINLAGLPAQPPVTPTLGYGLVYPGKRHVFSGPQESAKTLAAYAIAIHEANTAGPVVIIDYEMGMYDARNRLVELGATTQTLERIHYIEPNAPATPDRISLLIALSPTLVIIDAAAGAYNNESLDDNARKDVERWSALYIKPLWQNNIATIVLDHVVKNTENRAKYAIGSERKTGGVDVHLGFDTIIPIRRGSTGIYKITTHKDRPGYHPRGGLAEMHINSHPETHHITFEFKPIEHVEPGQEWLPTKVMQHISELLEREPEPLSRNSTLTLAGGKREVAQKAIEHLVRLGYLTETSGARGAKLLTHTRSFTILEWENDRSGDPKTPPIPTYSHLFPEHVHPLVPPHPFRGVARELVDAPENGSPVPDQDDEETTAMLNHYNLLEPPASNDHPTRDDWVDELTPTPDDDLPI